MDFSLSGHTDDWDGQASHVESLIKTAIQQLAAMVEAIIAASERIRITMVEGGVAIRTLLTDSLNHVYRSASCWRPVIHIAIGFVLSVAILTKLPQP